MKRTRLPLPPPPPEPEGLMSYQLAILTAITLICFIVLAKRLCPKSPMLGLVFMPLVLLDFGIWLVTLGPLWMLISYIKAPRTLAVKRGTADINDNGPPSAIWKHPKADEPLAFADSATAYDAFVMSVAKYPQKPAQGIRKLVDWRKEEGSPFAAKVFDEEIIYKSFEQLFKETTAFGAGLLAVGLTPQGPPAGTSWSTDSSKIMIYDDTSADWMTVALGAWSQQIVAATAYATLGIDAVIQAVNDARIYAIVCNRKSVTALADQLNKMPSVKVIIYLNYLCTPAEITTSLSKENKVDNTQVSLFSFEEVLAKGRNSPANTPNKPVAETVAVIMYTSGSTGKPKGVVIRHSHLLAVAKSVHTQFGERYLEGEEVYLAFLPLAHILELSSEVFSFLRGACNVYADPKSLTAGPGKCYPTGALQAFQPTMMCGVPKLWETILAGIKAKGAAGSAAKQAIFNIAFNLKLAAIRTYRYTPLFDKLVFAKVKAATGGRLKMALSGGGAISPEVQEWVRAAIGCPLFQGYGLTETCGGVTMQWPADLTTGIAGSQIVTIEIALHSESELTDSDGVPYKTTDTHHLGQPCDGRGEVWVRGANVSDGYFGLPELTSQEFKDGWFRTGDIGLMTRSGQLKIIDRKKNLVKLKGGEYVALEQMNVTYGNASIIDKEAGGVCCYADDSLDKPVAFAQCDATKLAALAATKLGVTDKESKELCALPAVMDAVRSELIAAAKEAKLPSLMHVAAVMPLVDPWSSTDGTLTATNKIVAKAIYAKHQAALALLKSKAVR
eukprot:CAMPEP_0119312396 /NCGR_PEP_ID=MMETSP1333-20130426/26258_1 /TAXON_ID=418940 /ORGANISM="Scyphosphaera apsteinii, Strain RCC1455" /LENGTH=783 /DNA_ID=CAMNT_0007317009 /DNA_START=75 /DNA_END=2426 /DNA_ORIENTATION=-